MGYSIWDSSLGTGANAFTQIPMVHEGISSFCSGMIIIPETGEMLIAGGSLPENDSVGISNTHFLDYRTDVMTMEPIFMNETRWYPTLTVLPDGRLLAQGGAANNTRNTDLVRTTPEIYTPGEGWDLLDGATSAQVYSGEGKQWWYPRSWVAPDGRVFGVAGDDMYYLDPNGNGSIEVVGNFPGSNFGGGSSTAVMYDEGKILQIGGGDPDNNSSPVQNASAEATIIDINGVTPVLSSAGSMNFARDWANSTVLPDGRVLVTGGGSSNNNPGGAVNVAEIWNPDTNQWTVVDEATSSRLYHSTALLMPDGTVFTGGTTTRGIDGQTSEIYRPDYLYNDDGTAAARPDITGGATSFDWGDSFDVNVAAGDDIDRVSLIAFGAVTHSFDMGQRFLELDFSQTGSTLTIDAPDSANIAPPGYYMLFALDANDVPSEAHIVNVTA